ncbi:MAG: DMT family transporter [Firmicutes bacterium]|nr:DMT family transporter [Bacillota bacterium]
MPKAWVYLLVAGVAGMTMAVQGTLNSILGKVIGLFESTFVVHLLGTLTVAVLLLLRLGQGGLVRWSQAPWYVYFGGLLSVLIIYGVSVSIPKVGVGNATTMIVICQILTAVAIDHFGLFGVERLPCRWWDLVGIALLGVGAKILLR